MSRHEFEQLALNLRSLTVFRAIKKDPLVLALLSYIDLSDKFMPEAIEAYSDMCSALFESGHDDISSYVCELVGNDENVYMRTVGRGESPSELLKSSVDAELEVLQKLADVTSEELCSIVDFNGYMPSFKNKKVDLKDNYKMRVNNISSYGYGIYAAYKMFYLNDDCEIVPVKYPDKITLDELVDYKREQQIILDNTQALLDGRPAANILLTGDAGTGKSSTVKAVVNELYPRGLRILEVRKEQLRAIPAILDELTQNPLKFILFIDDLSFQKDDDNYSALKAILEGSVSAKSQNTVIYATSNRRHLVKERFSDREGDDVHTNDTIQEIISLSERFGIRITFNRPDKATYLDIVHHLADARGIEYDTQLIDIAAERFALSKGTRSARAARQFIDCLESGTEKM